MSGRVVRVLHLSDIHCGRSYVPEHIAAAERLAAAMALDAIVVSGDLTQRAREQEFRDATVVLDRFRAIVPVLVVPGNHDAEWWRAPFGVGDATRVHQRFRTLVQSQTQPTLRVPGVSLIGLNSAAGMLRPALTWYPRDWRVKGGLTNAQLDDARARVVAAPEGDLRVLVVHHNIVRGRLSNRWGLARPHEMLDRFAGLGADVVCAGHDHEERLELVTRATGSVLSSTANTLSSRMRGHRPSAVTIIEADAARVTGTIWTYDASRREFVSGDQVNAPRR